MLVLREREVEGIKIGPGFFVEKLIYREKKSDVNVESSHR